MLRIPGLRQFLAGLLAALTFAALPLSAAADTHWDLPTPYPENNFHTENIRKFAADVAAASGGRLRISIHPNGSLFQAPEIRRAVEKGKAQAAELILSGFAGDDPFFALDTIPFLATSHAEARALWQASRKTVDEKLATRGLKVLFSVPWTPQGIYTHAPLDSLKTARGLRIRSYDATNVARLIELMGAQPVIVQAAELPAALAAGIVNASITSAATGYDSHSWEHFSDFTDLRAWLPKNVVMINLRHFNALDADTREVVLKAAAAAEERGWSMSEEKSGWYIEQLRQHGMAVRAPSPALAREFNQIGEQMLREWLAKTGADGKRVLDAYRQARTR